DLLITRVRRQKEVLQSASTQLLAPQRRFQRRCVGRVLQRCCRLGEAPITAEDQPTALAAVGRAALASAQSTPLHVVIQGVADALPVHAFASVRRLT
uniref:Uncharacterized protein n=1 Tax=Aegilops tauschii subsp. strangulata TaxID=200361 RepID=A0A453CRM6_AEGTS